MSEEKKSAVTEEVKEEFRKLTEEELEQVNGGMSTGATVQVKGEDIAKLNTTGSIARQGWGSSSNLIRRSARFRDAFSC